MFEITLKDNNEFCFKGEFSIGFLGTFIDNNVTVDLSNEFLVKIGACGIDKKTDLHKINQYFIRRQEEIKDNIGIIENTFLKFLFNDYFSCGDSFWADTDTDELCSFIIKEKMPKLEEDERYSNFVYAEKVFTSESDEAFYQGKNPDYDEIDDFLNNLSLDMKEYIKTYFPMISYDIFIKSIKEESCNLFDETISFCCSNPECGYCSICAAAAEIREGFILGDWHHR